MAVGVAAVWGLNFSVIKLGVRQIDPLVLAGLRFTLTAWPLVFWLPRPSVPWRWLAIYGMSFGVGTWGLVTMSLRAGLSPGLAAWLLQSSAFLTPLLAALWLGETMSRRQQQGGLLALAGLVGVVAASGGTATVGGMVLVMAAAAALSLANVTVRRARPSHVLGFLVWSSLFAPLPLFALAWATAGTAAFSRLPAQLDPVALASLAFQVYPTTLLGYGVWNTLIVRHSATEVAPVALLVPVAATLFSMVIFGTYPNLGQWAGIASIMAGLVVSLPPRLAGRRARNGSVTRRCDGTA
ncbi:EamA family transporter [Dyella sp.]|jgi:O-acetylserine/cysteine efflux transporter|uniref:EamA family transporter n=1 Tax=Dyella sp. TaxID=1869338 RepID=UPI002D774BA1|nr:EamA family transporter [Dyella sp.]HET6432682.1 EamA family transporter [Dyella sp.]